MLVDASQAAVHGAVDVRAWDADFVVATGHKLYGPTGIGVLYGKAETARRTAPVQRRRRDDSGRDARHVTYNVPPHRFEAGTPPIAQAVGLGAALDYMESVGREAIAAHEAELTAYAHERLGAINSLRIIGTAPGKGPILSFAMEGAHAHDIATLIDRSGVAVRAGTHCAMPLLQRFGVTSTCRASFALYNTRAEIDVLADALVRAHKLFAVRRVMNEPALKSPASMSAEDIATLTDGIIAALKTVYDPEIPADIYELGLIYNVDIDDERNVAIEMTLTAPGCPVAGEMPGLGGERGQHRGGREKRQGDDHLRSAMGPEPHVGRGASGARHVLSETFLASVCRPVTSSVSRAVTAHRLDRTHGATIDVARINHCAAWIKSDVRPSA